MLTLIHANPACIVDGRLRVDRKFHSGMQFNVRKIHEPMVSIHPQAAVDEQIMDVIEIPLDQLGYEVMTVELDSEGEVLPRERERMRSQIARSKLMYGNALDSVSLAQELSVPYIMIIEYDLKTQIKVTTSEVSSRLRRVVRSIRRTWGYVRTQIPEMRRAYGLHCNGYPIFDAVHWFNDRRLLYLDSRMSADLVITPDELRIRLQGRHARPLRLLYSGRYEASKGAIHAIQVGLECMRLGLEFELHCYGQGSLKAKMQALAAQAEGKASIFVHDAIAYPDLVKLSRTFDIFVCCHIQSDPSCTYLESFGAGLPVVGYNNRMWKRLSQESGAGFATRLGAPALVAQSVKELAEQDSLLISMSNRAREFALEHCFEREHASRTSDINTVLASSLV